MSKILFFGNLESLYIGEVLKLLVFLKNEIIMSVDSYQILKPIINGDEVLEKSVKTWSWNDMTADYYIQDVIIDVFPYLYPDAVDSVVLKKLLKIPFICRKSYGNFRLGFGVQEELFDLFLAQLFDVEEIAYFDLISSMQLLNPVSQLEYRKKSYEFFRYVDKEYYNLSDQMLVSKRYKIINPIPFFESFTKEIGHAALISHYTLNVK